MSSNLPRHAIWRPGMTWDAIEMLTQANVPESLMARMLGGNAAQQFGIELVQTVGA